jgi:hypothetical protein
MKKSTVFATAFFFLTSIALYAQSLGDVAREEQKRRDAIADEKIITLESAPSPAPEPAPVTGNEVSTSDKDAHTKPGNPKNDEEENGEEVGEDEEDSEFSDEAEESDTDDEAYLYGGSESYWRNSMADVRSRLRQFEDEAKLLASRRNALQRQHSITNGARRGPVRDEINKTMQAQEINKRNLDQARKELLSVQSAARSSGALPGWLY